MINPVCVGVTSKVTSQPEVAIVTEEYMLRRFCSRPDRGNMSWWIIHFPSSHEGSVRNITVPRYPSWLAVDVSAGQCAIQYSSYDLFTCRITTWASTFHAVTVGEHQKPSTNNYNRNEFNISLIGSVDGSLSSAWAKLQISSGISSPDN